MFGTRPFLYKGKGVHFLGILLANTPTYTNSIHHPEVAREVAYQHSCSLWESSGDLVMGEEEEDCWFHLVSPPLPHLSSLFSLVSLVALTSSSLSLFLCFSLPFSHSLTISMVRLQTKVRLGPGTLTLIPGYLSYEYFTQGYSLPSSQAPSSSLPSAWEQSWWRVGAWAAALCSPIACLLVLGALVVQILSLLHWCLASPIPPGDSDIPSAPTIPILPLIPGWTIPGYHTPVVLGALLTTALVHEAGHFLAARYASVPVRSFGLFLLLLFPGAFVRLDEESLSSQSSKTQWKIAAAGIWHNLLLLLLASLLLFAQWTDYLSVGLGAYRRIQDGVVVISVSSVSNPFSFSDLAI